MNPKVRSDFPVTRELAYLDTAYYSPYPLPVLRAGQDFLERRSRGIAGRVGDWLRVLEQVRVMLAELINATPNEIAITTNTTEGTNIVATSLKLEQGDNVVWDDLDYSGNAAVWFNQEITKGVENRVVSSKGGAPQLIDFERVVDNRTKVISISYVSHRNGHVHDIKGLADLAHAHGAYLHVDAIQAVGAIQVDVKRTGIDFLTCGTYKWLLGPIGLAFFYVREQLLSELQSLYGGAWQVKTWADDSHLHPSEMHESARKFECATVHYQGMYELKAALDYINQIGMDKIEKQILRLTLRLRRGLDDLGIELTTPLETRSGVVTCVVNDPQKTAQLLIDNGIVASVRPVGEVRVSPHFFNTDGEIDHLLTVLGSR